MDSYQAHQPSLGKSRKHFSSLLVSPWVEYTKCKQLYRLGSCARNLISAKHLAYILQGAYIFITCKILELMLYKLFKDNLKSEIYVLE